MKTPESLNKKIIYILYRVSTKKQVHKVRSQQHGAVKTEDDIPMQRMACHEFVATKENWVIGKEFKEAGVSGSKVSADDRDAIQDLKEGI